MATQAPRLSMNSPPTQIDDSAFPQGRDSFPKTQLLCGAGACVLGLTALIGWATPAHFLTQLGYRNSIPMAPNTGLCFFILGSSLIFLVRKPSAPWARGAIRLAAVVVATMGLIRVGELTGGLTTAIDGWLMTIPPQPNERVPIGQMAMQTAWLFFCSSLALLILLSSPSRHWLEQTGGWLATAVAATGFVFFLGYLYDSPLFGDLPLIPMALNTSIGFIFLGVGLVAFTGAHFAILAPFCGASVQARLLRAFLPFTALVVCLTAWLMHMISQRENASVAALISATMVVPAIFLAGFVCLRIARLVGGQLEQAGAELKQAEQQARTLANELFALNETLEKRVGERSAAAEARTRELALSEQALRDQTRILQSLLENIGDGVVVANTQGKFLIFNPAAQRILGLGAMDGTPADWSAHYGLFKPDAATPFPSHDLPLTRALRGESVDDDELFVRHAQRPQGLILAVSARPLHDDAGRLTGGVAVFRDVTKRRRAEAALRENEEKTRQILESAAEGIYGIDLEGNCTFINPAGAHMIECTPEEVLGKNMHDVLHHSRADGSPYPVEDCPIFQAFQTGCPCRIAHEVFWRKGKSSFPVEYTSHPIVVGAKIQGAVVTFTDITERKCADDQMHYQNRLLQDMAESERQAHAALKQAQSQMVQTEKLAALGQLVAGVAHEINNPLSFVSNNVAVLQRDVASLKHLVSIYQEGDPVLKKEIPELANRVQQLAQHIDLTYTLSNLDGLMNRSRDGLKRIQHIVKDLRDFARLDESDLQEVNLNEGIASTLNIVTGQARKLEVELILDLQPLPTVTCYPAKINQVILNLVANALDACKPGGQVTVSARPHEEGVLIEIADTGHGIPPDIAAKIFDPFFTTKPQGKGTGLGLSISYGIIRAHGGRIDFESRVDHGTRFRIWLPRRCRHIKEEA